MAGTAIGSQIKIKLSLVSQSMNNFESFMISVDADVARIGDSTVAPQVSSILALGMALQLTKNIMDTIAGVCHSTCLTVILVIC